MNELNARAVREFLERFASAKGHFKNSQRELLLASRDAITVFVELTEHSDAELLGLPANVLRGVAALLDFLVAQIPESGKEKDVIAAKRQAIMQLIDVLEIEAEKTGKKAAAQTDLAKVEALQGLVKYLRSELNALGNDSAPSKKKRQRITRIDIE